MKPNELKDGVTGLTFEHLTRDEKPLNEFFRDAHDYLRLRMMNAVIDPSTNAEKQDGIDRIPSKFRELTDCGITPDEIAERLLQRISQLYGEFPSKKAINAWLTECVDAGANAAKIHATTQEWQDRAAKPQGGTTGNITHFARSGWQQVAEFMSTYQPPAPVPAGQPRTDGSFEDLGYIK